MPIILIKEELSLDQKIDLSSDQIKHFIKSLRMKSGDEVQVGSVRGKLFLGQLEGDQKNWIVKLIEELTPPVQPIPITLYLSLIKKDKFEWVIQKAVELNIDKIVPIISDRSVLREISPNYFERLEKIILSACEQSERLIPLRLEKPHKVYDASTENITHCVAMERMADCTMVRSLESRADHSFGLWIGPEGGWSDQERDFFMQNKFQFISFGDLILRAETAAVTGINYLKFFLNG